MHVVLGILTSVVTILYLLDRMGVNIGAFNPFHWRRRRAWAKKYEGDPIYSVEDPLHVAAILTIGVVKMEGDMTAEQKAAMQQQFESVFSLTPKAASDLMVSAAHLLGGPQVIETQLSGLRKRNKDRLSPDQVESVLKMMRDAGSAAGTLSDAQENCIEQTRIALQSDVRDKGSW